MTDRTTKTYLEPTQDAGRAFFTRGISGSVVMLNLLRFRPAADYSATPEFAPAAPISGEAAYRLYMEHTLPHLKKSGGEVLIYGQGGEFLIGPSEERWDAAMLVQQSSVATFLAFASNQERGDPSSLNWLEAMPSHQTDATSDGVEERQVK
jgi:virulence-associated protein VagC